MIERGRAHFGSTPKLSPVEMLEAKCYADMGIHQYSIANFMGVGGSTVQKAIKVVKKDPFKLQQQHKEIEAARKAKLQNESA